MIHIEFLTASGCSECEKAKIILDSIGRRFQNVRITKIDILSKEGFTLATKYGILANPGIIVNGRLISAGSLDKEMLIKEIEACSAAKKTSEKS